MFLIKKGDNKDALHEYLSKIEKDLKEEAKKIKETLSEKDKGITEELDKILENCDDSHDDH